MERRDRNPGDPELKKRIQELIDGQGGGYNAALVADIIENSLKLLTDVESRGDVRVIQTALRELRYAFKLFAPYFAPGVLDQHRAGLRKIMRRLAPCRDAAVFQPQLRSYLRAALRPSNHPSNHGHRNPGWSG